MKTLGLSNLKSAFTETTVVMVAMETSVNAQPNGKRVNVFFRLYRSESFHFWMTHKPLSSLRNYRGVFGNTFFEIFYEFLCQQPLKNGMSLRYSEQYLRQKSI